jgi:hypothetical protein
MEEYQLTVNKLNEQYYEAMSKNDAEAIKRIQMDAMALESQQGEKVKEMISSMGDSFASLAAIGLLNPKNDFPFIDELITRLFYNSIEKVNMCSGIYYQRENPQSTTRKISKKLIGVGYSFPWLYKFSVENGYSKIDYRLERYYWQETIKHMYWVVKRWPYWIKFKATADALKYLEISFFELSGYNYSLINYVADSEIKLNKRVGILFIRLLMLIVFVSVKVEKLVRKKHV